ncbi:MAG: hypothetical protein ACFFD1_04970, partial [Candidatus Thorarchaeota archaeon]
YYEYINNPVDMKISNNGFIYVLGSYFLVKLDSTGNLIWEIPLTGNGVSLFLSNNKLIVSSVQYFNSNPNIFYINYLNLDGTELSNKTYESKFVEQTSYMPRISIDNADNAYILTEKYSYQFDAWYLTKYSSNGTELWNDIFYNLNWPIWSKISGQDLFIFGKNNESALFIENINGLDGSIIWNKTWGGSNFGFAVTNDLVQSPDSKNLYLVGVTNGYGNSSNYYIYSENFNIVLIGISDSGEFLWNYILPLRENIASYIPTIIFGIVAFALFFREFYKWHNFLSLLSVSASIIIFTVYTVLYLIHILGWPRDSLPGWIFFVFLLPFTILSLIILEKTNNRNELVEIFLVGIDAFIFFLIPANNDNPLSTSFLF